MKARQSKGITLIALIVTIIILLILVAVISIVILTKSQEGTKENGTVTAKETSTTKGNTKALKPGDKASSTVKNNYTDSNKDTATIPEGFTVSKTDNTINEGLVVIGPDGSEFVWIPIDEDLKVKGTEDKYMARESTGEYAGQTGGLTNYEGVLYKFEAVYRDGKLTESTSKEGPDPYSDKPYGQSTLSYREPALLDTKYSRGWKPKI